MNADSEKKTDSTSPDSHFPIDAVITWVDGADPKHAAKLNAYLATLGGKRPRAASPMRFHHSGELDYCVASLLRFAPWIRTIYIVTDEQVPPLMETLKGSSFEDRIKVIDHREIFSGYEEHLPSFNSMSITSMLWRIPGLAEHFIFFNDDFALLHPVTPEDFFREEKVVLRGRWRLLPEKRIDKRLLNMFMAALKITSKDTGQSRVSFQGVQQQSARVLGFNQHYFRLSHTPHAWHKSTWQEAFYLRREEMINNMSHRLRSATQFVPEGFSAHTELKNNRAIIDNRRTNLQLKPAQQARLRVKYKLSLSDRNENIIFTCVQSIEAAPEKTQKLIIAWLDRRIGSLQELCERAPV